METTKRLYFQWWRGIMLSLSLASIAYVLYGHRLGTLLPGYSTAEIQSYTTARDWHIIATNPLYAPYKLLVWLSTAVFHHDVLMTRAVAVGFGVAAALIFFAIIHVWYGFRVAFLATIMFATSAGLLHFARLGTGYILQMGILAPLGLILWYRSQQKHRLIISYLLIVCSAVLWYVPGMVWFEILGLIALWPTVWRQVRRSSVQQLAGALVLFLAILAPLALACARHPQLFLQVAGLPQSFGGLPQHAVRDFRNTALSIFFRSNGNPSFWVGHAPLLSAVEVILALLGGYYIWHVTLGRRLFLFGSAGLAFVLASLGGISIACLVPILYIFIAAGLDHLLGRWLAVFPLNPIARSAGVAIMTIALSASVLYQTRSYFVAWPLTPATRQVFSHHTT